MPSTKTTDADWLDQHVTLPLGLIAAALVAGSRPIPRMNMPDYIRFALVERLGYDDNDAAKYIKQAIEKGLLSKYLISKAVELGYLENPPE